MGGWGQGVLQGQQLRECPTPDPPMPISKTVLWEGPGSQKGSVPACFLLCSLPGCGSTAFTGQQDPGEQFCALLFLLGMSINGSALVAIPLPTSVCSQHCFLNHWQVPSLGENSE